MRNNDASRYTFIYKTVISHFALYNNGLVLGKATR